jgi:hypothetical protein
VVGDGHDGQHGARSGSLDGQNVATCAGGEARRFLVSFGITKRNIMVCTLSEPVYRCGDLSEVTMVALVIARVWILRVSVGEERHQFDDQPEGQST